MLRDITSTMHNLTFLRRAALAALLLGTARFGDAAEPADRFGFAGKEIFPIDNQIGQLRAGDLDGDGLTDLVLVNNLRSKLTVLYNRTGKTNDPATATQPVKRDLNELPPDARFRIDSIASEKRIASMTVADLNSDQRPDIAFFGDPSPKELVILYNQGANGWASPKRWTVEDALLDPNSLVHGDLNGDGRTDLLLVAEGFLYWFAQKPDHSLAEPERIPYSEKVKSVHVLDIDGDGREDLLLVNWESPNSIRLRFQNPAGQLGPEMHFLLTPIRSYWADDLDGDRKTEIITIAKNSGRAQISNFTVRPAETLSGDLRLGQFQILPLNKTSKAQRGVLWADLNQDALADLLVAEPESGQLTVFLQQKDGSLGGAKTFPTFTGVTELAVADWDADGRPDIFFLSSDERQVGVSHWDANGRIAFPRVLPITGRPLAMTVGPLRPGAARPTLAVILDQDGKRELHTRTAEGEMTTQRLSENFKSNPNRLAMHDINQDGLADLIVLIHYEKVKILLHVPDKPFEELDVSPPGGSVEQPWLSVADIDSDGKDELLLAQKNFLRAVVLQADKPAPATGEKPAWSLGVKEQINGASSSSRIVGAAYLPSGGGQGGALFLLDAEKKALSLCERDPAGVWQVVRNVPLPVLEFSNLRPVGLGSATPNSLAFVGLNTVAWLPFQGSSWELTELDGYETPIKDGYLLDVVSGDLNHDGRKDLVFLETGKNHLDIVTYEPPHNLVPANRWQVFEERTFRGRGSAVPEPREALVIDLTGDGRNDLAVVVHDRVIVYPQE